MNLKNLKNFKFGVKHLTPEQRLKVTITSTLWGSIGLTMAFLSMAYAIYLKWDWKMFGFEIFLLFMIILQMNQWGAAKQQLEQTESFKATDDNMKKIQKAMKGGD